MLLINSGKNLTPINNINMKKQTVLFFLNCFIAVTILSCSDSGSSSDNNSNGVRNQSQAEEVKTEWTQWLDKYENLVERNNALQSRIKSGDMNAAQEVMSISQELMEVSQKCQENQSAMSASEVKRMMEIMQKIKY